MLYYNEYVGPYMSCMNKFTDLSHMLYYNEYVGPYMSYMNQVCGPFSHAL